MYKQITLFNPEEHHILRFKAPEDFRFAKKLNILPIGLSEVSHLCCDYPIVFVEHEKNPYLALLVGLDTKADNLAIDEEGHWRGDYIPAILRSYPFTFVPVQEDKYALAFDMQSGCFSSPEGEPLFDQEQKATELFEQRRSFAANLREELLRTQAWVKSLTDHGILVPKTLTVGKGDSAKNFSGILLPDQEKINRLEDKTLAQWSRNGWFKLLALQELSLNNIHKLTSRLDKRD